MLKKLKPYRNIIAFAGVVLMVFGVNQALLFKRQHSVGDLLGVSTNQLPGPTTKQLSGKQQYIVRTNPAIGGPDFDVSQAPSIIRSTNESVVTRNADILESDEVQALDNLPFLVATLDSPAEVRELADDPDVIGIEENFAVPAQLFESVPLINADDVADAGFDGTGTAVAILDTGVDSSHSFVNNVAEEACYSNASGFGGGTELCPGEVSSLVDDGAGEECTGFDGCDHGTHVAGIAAGDGDGVAFTGVAPGAEIIPIQVFTGFSGSNCGSGYGPGDTCVLSFGSDMLSGLNHVISLAVGGYSNDIASVNLSIGGGLYNNQSTCDAISPSMKTAIETLRDTYGIVTTISSGNNGSSTRISWPGCISTAVAVGSTTKSDNISSFSNSNSLVEVFAPGSSIYSSVPGGSFSYFSGTSMAAPTAAGVFALLKQADPDSSGQTLIDTVIENGVTVNDSRNGLDFPRVDALASLEALPDLITVNVADETSGEDESTATVQFRLRSMPSGDVTIPLSLSDTTEGDLSGVSEIVIAAADWDDLASNEVTITGVDDSIQDSDQPYTLITGDPTSTDLAYGNLDADDVANASLTNTDDESPTQWGNKKSGDIPVSMDYDGDGISDVAVFRPSRSKGVSAKWFITQSSDESQITINWGNTLLGDIPMPADYDGDDSTEIAVWRPSNGTWYFQDGSPSVQWGNQKAGDTPVLGDFDGDGEADPAVWRTKTGFWYVKQSTDSSTLSRQWGNQKAGDEPVPADYDGDGKTDFAVYRRSSSIGVSAVWWIWESQADDSASYEWGNTSGFGDNPYPKDYDGDDVDEIAVWRPSDGTWYFQDGSDAITWGDSDDQPTPNYYDNNATVDVSYWENGTGLWKHFIVDN